MFKKFFYACAASLCLILAYHFGATNAQGQQIGSYFEVIQNPNGLVVRSGNSLYSLNGPPDAAWWGIVESLPTTASSVVYWDGRTVVASTGEAWRSSGGTWMPIDPVPGGATTIQRETWSSIKAKNR